MYKILIERVSISHTSICRFRKKLEEEEKQTQRISAFIFISIGFLSSLCLPNSIKQQRPRSTAKLHHETTSTCILFIFPICAILLSFFGRRLDFVIYFVAVAVVERICNLLVYFLLQAKRCASDCLAAEPKRKFNSVFFPVLFFIFFFFFLLLFVFCRNWNSELQLARPVRYRYFLCVTVCQ